MKKFIIVVERYIIRFIILSLAGMVVVQGLMTQDNYRFYLSLGERMEGENLPQAVSQPYNESETLPDQIQAVQQVASPQARMIISLEKFSSLPKAAVSVNDYPVMYFTEKEIILEITAGDMIEIDATYYNFPVTFKIKDVSGNLAFPEKGLAFQTNQGIAMVGKAIVK